MATSSHRSTVPSLLLAASFAGLASAQNTANDNLSKGFLEGLKGFEKFHEPIGQPIYFESPFNDTGIRFIYLKHEFSDQSFLQGGDLQVIALQARVALSERLQFIATKDGYSILDAGALPEDEGWNDIGFGLKYVFAADRAQDYVAAAGLRYTAENGHRGILQGGVDEWSPFVSFAKGYNDLHFVGNVTLRLPLDGDDGNTVGHWDVHADYDINPGQEAVFAPVFEVHGVHYLDDGASAIPVGGLDYANLGSQPAESFVCWAGLGARLEIQKRFELGLIYEFALTDPDDDIMDQRITLDFFVRF